MKGLLGNMWDNKESIVGGLFNIFNGPKKEAELGADINYGLLAQNFAPDIKETGEEIKTMVTNPRETGKAVVDLVGGAWRTGLGKVMPEGVMDFLESVDKKVGYDSKPREELAQGAWKDIVATHGSIDGFKKFAQENPFEAMLELTGAGLVARQVKNVTAPVVKNAIQAAEETGLMDHVRKFGSLPVGLSIIDVNKRYPGVSDEIKKQLAMGLGRDRIADDLIIEALNKGVMDIDVKKTGTPLEHNYVSAYDVLPGRVVASGMADASSTGQTIREVGGKEVGYGGSIEEGGQQFADKFLNMAWANDPGTISTLVNNLKESEKLRVKSGLLDDTAFAPFQMGLGAINFSVQMVDTMVKAAKTNLPKKQIADIDDKIRTTEYLKTFNKGKPDEFKKKVLLNPDFVGLDKVDLTKLSGPQKKDIIRILDTNARDDIGSMLQHQLANSDPQQLITDPYTLHNVMIPDKIAPNADGFIPSGHRTYGAAVPGQMVGRLKEPINLLDLMVIKDNKGKRITNERMKGSKKASLNKSIMGQKIRQVITEEDVDRAVKTNQRRMGLLL
tara:strand:- start:402 stop:2075 length:1674 start_codon:yes stop_codon:yes gene_type:complete